MNTSKQQYIDNIRSNTAYPTYRGIIGIIAIFGYLLAGLKLRGQLRGQAVPIDIFVLFRCTAPMPRKPRIEYAGAVYQMIARFMAKAEVAEF